MTSKYILWFNEVTNKDVGLVGGKNASLGEMYQKLKSKGVNIPFGFAVTSFAYQYFLKSNNLIGKIQKELDGLDTNNLTNLQNKAKVIRDLITSSPIPKDLEEEIILNYGKLSNMYQKQNTDVAIRSSATAEDLEGASFAGQQASFLNISGHTNLLKSIRECFASLFTDRAISYRVDKGFDHLKTYLSVGVQKMVRSDKACSGVMFTLDPDTGFKDVIVINGIWGLGELIVQGKVIPDEYEVFKPAFNKGFKSIITKNLGNKDQTLIYDGNSTKIIKNPLDKQQKFTLTDQEVLTLSKWAVQIENHYQKPMDIEWAKDGESNKLFIVQARPETIHAGKVNSTIEDFQMLKHNPPVLKGIAVGTKIAQGQVHIIADASQINKFQKGEVLVTKITDPDWEPIMKIASAIVTNEGGRTSHAAIVSRELGIPCVIGTKIATQVLKDGDLVEVDANRGIVKKLT